MTSPLNSNSAHRAADYGAPYSDANPPSADRPSDRGAAPASLNGAIPYADIQKIRSGMPVERTWDLYPRLSAFMSEHVDAITGDPCALIGDPTFTKLIVAAFGNGKTTLCDQLTSQWVNAGLVASLISIEEKYSLNKLHINLLKAMRSNRGGFFHLLLSASRDHGQSSSNRLIGWVHKNHVDLARVIDDFDFQYVFWNWFADNRIRQFSDYLKRNDIEPMYTPISEQEGRAFFYAFLDLLRDARLYPLLLVDELETIAAIRNSKFEQIILTQVRELVDNAPGHYSLLLATTQDYALSGIATYPALYDRLYNEPLLSLHATSWHLTALRELDAIRDFLRALYQSNHEWVSIDDSHVEEVVQLFAPNDLALEDMAGDSPLRQLLRHFVMLLDESVALGAYRGYLIEDEPEPEPIKPPKAHDEQEQSEDSKSTVNADGAGSYFGEEEDGCYDEAGDYGSSPSASESDLLNSLNSSESLPAWEDLVGIPPLMTEEELSAYANSLTSSDDFVGSTAPAPDTKPESKEDALAPPLAENEKKKKEESEDENKTENIYHRLVNRLNSHSIESLTSLLVRSRESNVRLLATDNPRGIEFDPLFEIIERSRPIPLSQSRFDYEAALVINTKTKEEAVIIGHSPRELGEASDWQEAMAFFFSALSNEVNLLSELRRITYSLLITLGMMADDTQVDAFVLNMAKSAGGRLLQARGGEPFLIPDTFSMRLFSASRNRGVKVARYRDEFVRIER